jgi:hypothetical protein
LTLFAVLEYGNPREGKSTLLTAKYGVFWTIFDPAIQRFIGVKLTYAYCMKRKTIHSFVPDRPRAKPFVFFKGSERTLRTFTSTDILNAFEKAGVTYANTNVDLVPELTQKIKDALDSFAGNEGIQSEIISAKIRRRDGGRVFFKITKRTNGRIVIHQYPVTHAVSGRKENMRVFTFPHLKAIVEKGFEGHAPPNVAVYKKRGVVEGRHATISQGKHETITLGDRYSIEFMEPVTESSDMDTRFDNYFLKKAGKTKVFRINIRLGVGTGSEREKRYGNPAAIKKMVAQKKKFYREQFPNRSIRFV